MKTVMITGANRSIGLETARQLAQAGYHIFLGSRDAVRGRQAKEQLASEGLNDIDVIPIAVNDPQSVQQAATLVAGKTNNLDVLINNAGILGSRLSSSAPDMAVIREVFDTNFFGAIQTTAAFMDLLKKSDAPRIVNVTSDLGSLTLHCDPSWSYAHFKNPSYGPSKTALNAYTVALAYELKDTAFKVNAVNPGYTATDFNNHSGTKNVADAARVIVQYAMLPPDGPTGGYFSDYGITPW